MIKKKIIFLICLSLIVSCGKKGDPKYKESQKDYLIKNIPTRTT